MTGFTDAQTHELICKLDRRHVKERVQAGRKVSYIESWHAIAEANRIFGFDAWDRETVEMRPICESETTIGKGGQYERAGWRVGYLAKVRVTVHCGKPIVREGTGYGSGIDADLGAAHESAAKEAESDAAKRALMTFGNQFGLALYDKEQTQVEEHGSQPGSPPSLPREPSGEAARSPSPRAPVSPPPGLHPKYTEALDAYNRLKKAIQKAANAKIIDDILRINQPDLALIHEVSQTARDTLDALADHRRSELLATMASI